MKLFAMRYLYCLISVAFINSACAQWTAQTPPAGNTQVLYGVYAIDDTLVGASGFEKVCRTTDGGTTWTNPLSFTGIPFYSINAGDNTRYFSHSGNSQTWQVRAYAAGGVTLNGGMPSNIFDTYKTSLSTGYVAGAGGKIQKTVNEGNNWGAPLPTGTTANLRGIYFTDANTGYAVGDNTTIIKTVNAGNNWSNNIAPVVGQLNDVWFGDMNTGYIVANGGEMLKTTNAGGNWAAITVPTNANLNDVWFFDPDTGYVCGDGGLILKTIDGGNSWINMPNPTSHNLYGIHFANPASGWCVGGQTGVEQVILKYDGGGCTLAASSVDSLKDVTCFGDSNGCVYTSPNGGTPPYSYLWSNAATSEDICNIPAGSYTVTVTDNDNCQSTLAVVIVEPAPLLANGSATATSPPNCTGDATVNPSGGTPGYSYLWDAAAGNQTTQTATGLCEGTYCVNIMDTGNCELDTCIDILSTGIGENELNKPFRIYPNPTTGEVLIDGPGISLWSIYDSGGSLIMKGKRNSADLSGYPAGLYLIEGHTNKDVFHLNLLLIE